MTTEQVQEATVTTDGIAYEELKVMVMVVLVNSPYGKNGVVRAYRTSYQVLAELSEQCRKTLEAVYGSSGKGSGGFSAAQRISQVLNQLVNDGLVESAGLDTTGMQFVTAGGDTEPGYGVCALYRLR